MRIPSLLILLATAGTSIALGQNSATDFSAMQAYEAHAVAVTGQVSRIRDDRPWALSSGERVPIQQVITTGGDGYARFEVAGGSSFELFSNSRVVFRQNAASAGDLLDVVAGRVRIHLQPGIGQHQERVFTPVAIVTAREPATIAVAIDEDDTVRVDVIEGAILVQHTLLPRNEPTLVRAIDAIMIQKDQPISRRVDRGSLYRYT
ncbi:MAG: FecR family protein, partial [Bryobacteraceae bacterium]